MRRLPRARRRGRAGHRRPEPRRRLRRPEGAGLQAEHDRERRARPDPPGVAADARRTSSRARTRSTSPATSPRSPARTRKPPAQQGTDGKSIFSANCASCHTLKAAAATGTIGPNLDQLKPSFAIVAAPGRGRRRRHAGVQGQAHPGADRRRGEVRRRQRRQVGRWRSGARGSRTPPRSRRCTCGPGRPRTSTCSARSGSRRIDLAAARAARTALGHRRRVRRFVARGRRPDRRLRRCGPARGGGAARGSSSRSTCCPRRGARRPASGLMAAALAALREPRRAATRSSGCSTTTRARGASTSARAGATDGRPSREYLGARRCRSCATASRSRPLSARRGARSARAPSRAAPRRAIDEHDLVGAELAQRVLDREHRVVGADDRRAPCTPVAGELGGERLAPSARRPPRSSSTAPVSDCDRRGERRHDDEDVRRARRRCGPRASDVPRRDDEDAVRRRRASPTRARGAGRPRRRRRISQATMPPTTSTAAATPTHVLMYGGDDDDDRADDARRRGTGTPRLRCGVDCASRLRRTRSQRM